MDPISLFQSWFEQELRVSSSKIPAACCLSTVGLDGFPNARFLALKEVADGNFIISGPTKSRKGLEIEKSNQVALTFWWAASERQVRIQGLANQISGQLADSYFAKRNRASQLVSRVSHQGQSLEHPEKLTQAFQEADLQYQNQAIPRPKDWGVYAITPIRIEFLSFKDTRFHDRQLFEYLEDGWKSKLIQP